MHVKFVLLSHECFVPRPSWLCHGSHAEHEYLYPPVHSTNTPHFGAAERHSHRRTSTKTRLAAMLPGLGWSAGDVIKIIEVSTTLYSAFRDGYKNSENQVQLLVKEFMRFHEFLQKLAQLLRKYERPLPFGYEDFE